VDIFGIAITAFVFLVLLVAAIEDYRSREVTNQVWLISLFGLPLMVIRVGITGLWLLYGLQAVLVFFLVIASFRVGVLGGADGKAILIISLLYPWIILDPLWLFVSPFFVLFGGFLIVGIYSLWILLQNMIAWKKVHRSKARPQKPGKIGFWFTRRFSSAETEEYQWKSIEVPLVSYIFIVYTVLVILTFVFF
jgi:Flp pilus assembly protein protease CpaA